MDQAAAFLVLLCMSLSVVQGNECRKSKTVVGSAQSVAANSQEGGHIWQHIYGLTERPKGAENKETQEGKTLFVSESAFKTAWSKFQKNSFPYLQPQQCKVKAKGQQVDCVLARDLGVQTAYICKEVNKNSKICTKKVDCKQVKYVMFWYAQKNGKWVLNTAYPSESNDGVKSCPVDHVEL